MGALWEADNFHDRELHPHDDDEVMPVVGAPLKNWPELYGRTDTVGKSNKRET